MRRLILLVSLGAWLGCGGKASSNDAAPRDDAALHDAGPPVDAAPTPPDGAAPSDAAPSTDARAAGPHNRELTPAAGAVSGGGYTVQFQLGHWTSQKKVSGGSTSIEGAAAIKP